MVTGANGAPGVIVPRIVTKENNTENLGVLFHMPAVLSKRFLAKEEDTLTSKFATTADRVIVSCTLKP